MSGIFVKYEQGRLILDLHSVLEQVDPVQKREMLESLSCDGEVIEFVTQQIIEKWTENMYHGSLSYTAPLHPYNLDQAWRAVAKASGDVAKREIERLESALAKAEEESNRLRSENFSMRRGAPND